ncbi:MAG TPA: NAD(P)-binding domain-containing protein [Gallionella sp.]|nr:NAD(P)-binding domain-containing protein [Gallionella sp.]
MFDGLHTELFYGLLICATVTILAVYISRHRKRSASALAQWQEVIAAGLTEPPSLHPVIDPAVCIGAGSCATACPESAIGLINNKAVLINPSHCIGHGACAAQCPSGAIRLVFGTEKRGIDIPHVNPNFETNVEGLFIAGELGGMGLIRKAAEQGKQAIGHISKRRVPGADYDVIIVGAGPAGITSTLAAQEKGLRYLTIEQEETFGGTTLHYPRRKLVMTAPMQLPLYGQVNAREISKEALMELWTDVVNKTDIKIRFNERMTSLRRDNGMFTVVTQHGQHTAGCVLLAIGRRGTPRKLGVPGEEQTKVIYRLTDASQYRGSHALVVGGGDSALEAALSLSEEPDTHVTLSYRSDAFSKVKPKNRERMKEAEQAGRITVLMKSNVTQIEPDCVMLDYDGQPMELRNDVIIVCAGGTLPIPMLKDAGVNVDTRYGT